MKKIRLIIQGMHCASCASNIERSLKKVSGVKEVSVSLMMNKGIVEAEDNVNDEELKKVVARTRYKVINLEKT